MTGLGVGLFSAPVALTGFQHALLLAPLSLAISVVYKTIRCQRVREVPQASLVLCATIIAGMYAVGVGMWLLHLVFT